MPRFSISAAQIEACLQQGDDAFATLLAQAQAMQDNGKLLLALDFYAAISDAAKEKHRTNII